MVNLKEKRFGDSSPCSVGPRALDSRKGPTHDVARSQGRIKPFNLVVKKQRRERKRETPIEVISGSSS